jgi:hypothetical protein
MIIRFALPEWLTGAREDQIRFPSGRPFQPLQDSAGLLPRPNQHMNVIGHYYEGAQIVASVVATAMESLYHQVRHFRAFQGHRSQPRGIQITIHPYEGFARRHLV